jgi:hypothetical protein
MRTIDQWVPRRFFAFGKGLASVWSCVLRTASASISRSSALVFAGWRGVGFHEVISCMWGCGRGIEPSIYGMSPCLAVGGLFRKKSRLTVAASAY